MATADDIARLTTEVALTNKDINRNRQILDKLDISIEKLTEISNNITKIVALHAQRLESHDETIKHLNRQKDETDRRIEVTLSEISVAEKRIYDEIKRENESLETKFETALKDVKNTLTTLEEKISSLKNFQWWVYGAIAVGSGVLTTVAPIIFKAIFKF